MLLTASVAGTVLSAFWGYVGAAANPTYPGQNDHPWAWPMASVFCAMATLTKERPSLGVADGVCRLRHGHAHQ
eukprot:932553-Prorocentrum_minimum.AAC.1